MRSTISILTIALALVISSGTHASTLPDGGSMAAGIHQFDATHVSGGNFVRSTDGLQSATVIVTGRDGLVIDGGKFSTAKPYDYTVGAELARGKGISLYNKARPVKQPEQAEPIYNLYSADEIKSIFASGGRVRIQKAFTSSDAHGVAPGDLTEAHALAALKAANAVADAREQTARKFVSAHRNTEVNGGTFAFRSVNQNLIAAEAGKLIWNGGDLVSSGGGGDATLPGSAGIDILGDEITSRGTIHGKLTAIQYDDRHRLNRDRWTPGKYLALFSNGDINVGHRGVQGGPLIKVSDGMLKIGVVPGTQVTDAQATHNFNLSNGSVTLEGRHRSTLLMLESSFKVLAHIDGGVSMSPAATNRSATAKVRRCGT